MKIRLPKFSNLAQGLRSSLQYVILFPSLAFAGGHESAHGSAHNGSGHVAGPETLIFPAINFTVYLLIMIFAYRKAVSPALKQKSVDVEGKIKKAEENLSRAETEYEKNATYLENIAEEKFALRTQIEEEGKRTAAAILDRVEESIRALQLDLSRRVSAEHSKAESEIRADVIRLATNAAKVKLEKEMKPEEDQRLRYETIRSLFS